MESHEEIQKQLEVQQQALTKIYRSVEQTRKYILWSVVGTVITFILPLIVLAFVLPRLLSNFQTSMGGLL